MTEEQLRDVYKYRQNMIKRMRTLSKNSVQYNYFGGKVSAVNTVLKKLGLPLDSKPTK